MRLHAARHALLAGLAAGWLAAGCSAINAGRQPAGSIGMRFLFLSLLLIGAIDARRRNAPPKTRPDLDKASGSSLLLDARQLSYNNPAKALKILRAMEAAGKLEHGQVLMAIGNVLQAMGGHDSDAVTYFERGDFIFSGSSSAQADPDKRPYALSDLNSWGMALDHEHRYEEATQIYQRGLRAGHTHTELQNNLGNVLRKLHRPHEATYHYSKALSSRPDQPLFRYNRGMSLRDLGPQYRLEAIDAFASALGVKQDFFQAQLELGNLQRHQALDMGGGQPGADTGSADLAAAATVAGSPGGKLLKKALKNIKSCEYFLPVYTPRHTCTWPIAYDFIYVFCMLCAAPCDKHQIAPSTTIFLESAMQT